MATVEPAPGGPDAPSAAPLLSIVTVSFNSAATIGDTLASVAAAMDAPAVRRHVEHWVIDGASSDDTLDIVRRHSHGALYLRSEPDAGIYDAMNKGLRAARGEYVWFLNSDDMLASTPALEALIGRLKDRRWDVVLCDIDMVDPSDVKRVVRRFVARGPLARVALGWHPPHPGFVARRELLLKLRGFDQRFRIAADYDLMLRVLAHPGVAVTDMPRFILTHMRAGGLSNGGLRAIARANRECAQALRERGHRWVAFSIACKLTRKVAQRLAPPPRDGSAGRNGQARSRS